MKLYQCNMEARLYRRDFCPKTKTKINYWVYPDWSYYMTFEKYEESEEASLRMNNGIII